MAAGERAAADRTVTSVSVTPMSAPIPAPAVSASLPVTPAAGQPQATPIASQPNMPANVPPPAPASHRGLYMAVGALLVLVALAAVGMYSRNADARRKASQAVVPAAQDSAPPAQPTPQAVAPPAPEAPAPPTVQEATGPASGTAHDKAIPASGVAKMKTSPQAVADAPPAIDLDALEHEIDQLSARAGAVNSGLDRLRDEQARSGYGLRGDIAGRQESMKLNLSKAQDAISRGDGPRAKRYSDLATADIDALEKFLGR